MKHPRRMNRMVPETRTMALPGLKIRTVQVPKTKKVPEQKTKRVTVPVTRVRTNLPGLTEKIPGLRIRQPKIILKTVLTRKTRSLLFRQSR